MKHHDLPDHIYQNLVDTADTIFQFIISFEEDGLDSTIIANAAIQACSSYIAAGICLESTKRINQICKETGNAFSGNTEQIAISIKEKITTQDVV